MAKTAPTFNQVNLVVRDMAATVAFYRQLGLAIAAAKGAMHVNVSLPNGMSVEFDSTEFVSQWDSGWSEGTGGSTVLGFAVDSRERVDELYGDLTGAGHKGRQRPFDTFWGARYAIVDDPDGNGIGIMSPIEVARKFWPPAAPPRGL